MVNSIPDLFGSGISSLLKGNPLRLEVFERIFDRGKHNKNWRFGGLKGALIKQWQSGRRFYFSLRQRFLGLTECFQNGESWHTSLS